MSDLERVVKPLDGMARTYVDRIPIGLLLEAIQRRTVPIDREVRGRFWSTEERPQDDPSREVFEVRLRDIKRVNYVTFEVPRFPHRATFQLYDLSLGWVDVESWDTFDSVPARIVTPSGPHPQHFGVDHWIKHSLKFEPITAERFRVVLVRGPGVPPLDIRNDEVPYSLGLRNFDIGYRVRSLSDIPDETISDPDLAFASTTDLLGSTVEFALHYLPSDNILVPQEHWKSEPQPLSTAVVPLYLDVRNACGTGRIIDRFYIDPLTPGALFNVYYTNDDLPRNPDLKARASRVIIAQYGNVEINDDGIKFTDPESYLRFANEQIQFNPTASWWARLDLTLFQPSAIQDRRPIARLGEWELFIAPQTLVLRSPENKDATISIDFPYESRCLLVWGYDTDQGIGFVEYRRGNQFFRAEVPVQFPGTVDPRLCDPNSNDQMAFFGPYEQDDFEYDEDIYTSAYLAEYGTGDEAPAIVADWTLHGFCLFQDTYDGTPDTDDPGKLLCVNPADRDGSNLLGSTSGFVPDYSQARWTPVPRTFALRKGYLRVPRIQARFWKFEFSNLIPEPYEVFTPVERSVLEFPPDVKQEWLDRSRGQGYPVPTKGQSGSSEAVHTRLASVPRYTGQTIFRPQERTEADDQLSPTEMLYAAQSDQVEQLQDASWQYRVQDWHVGDSIPRFTKVGLHVYDQQPLVHKSKTAYFVGIRDIRAYRLDYTVVEDTEVYRAHFHDPYNLATNSWAFDNVEEGDTPIPTGMGVIESTPGGVSVAESENYQSLSPVTALQFATSQSDPVSQMPDPDFQDFALALNDWERPARWHRHGSAQLAYLIERRAVRVTRTGADVGFPVDKTTTVDGPLAYPIGSTRDYYPVIDGVDPTIGGIESPPLTVSGRRIYAAARVNIETPLDADLYVQIVSQGGDVVAEEKLTTRGRGIKEWYVGYSAPASTLAPSGLVGPLSRPLTAGDSDDVAAPTLDKTYKARVVQKGATSDVFVVENLDLFDDGIFWEFSVDGGSSWVPGFDARNNPHGVVAFPTAGTNLRWRVSGSRPGLRVSSLQIRPWYDYQRAGKPPRSNRGPNLSVYDDFPPIEEDPEFKGWHHPIPRWWFHAFRHVGQAPIGYVRQRSASEDLFGRFTEEATRKLTLSRSGSDSAPASDRAAGRFPGSSIVQPLSYKTSDYGRPADPTVVPPPLVAIMVLDLAELTEQEQEVIDLVGRTYRTQVFNSNQTGLFDWSQADLGLVLDGTEAGDYTLATMDNTPILALGNTKAAQDRGLIGADPTYFDGHQSLTRLVPHPILPSAGYVVATGPAGSWPLVTDVLTGLIATVPTDQDTDPAAMAYDDTNAIVWMANRPASTADAGTPSEGSALTADGLGLVINALDYLMDL